MSDDMLAQRVREIAVVVVGDPFANPPRRGLNEVVDEHEHILKGPEGLVASQREWNTFKIKMGAYCALGSSLGGAAVAVVMHFWK